MSGISSLLKAVTTLLPPQVYVPLLVLAAIAAVPAWLHWVRTKQIAGRLRRMLRAASPEERAAHRQAAFELAGERPRELIYLADEAERLGQKGVFKQAVEALEATGKAPRDVRRLRALGGDTPPKRGLHPIEEAVIIERLWEQGLHAAARTRLAEVRAAFPEDPDLAEIQARLDAEEAPSDARDAG
jgi:hypothetical protein